MLKKKKPTRRNNKRKYLIMGKFIFMKIKNKIINQINKISIICISENEFSLCIRNSY